MESGVAGQTVVYKVMTFVVNSPIVQVAIAGSQEVTIDDVVVTIVDVDSGVGRETSGLLDVGSIDGPVVAAGKEGTTELGRTEDSEYNNPVDTVATDPSTVTSGGFETITELSPPELEGRSICFDEGISPEVSVITQRVVSVTGTICEI